MQSGRGAEHEAPLVLVCDDTEPIRRLLRINLELAGFRVAEAADGHAAMARLIDPEAQRPSVIVLDSQMAPYDGWWAIAAIRSHPRLDPVPVVLLTAAVIAHDAPQASDAGFDAFVAKPFDPDELIAAVSRLAERGRGTQSRR
ncbi:response regulator [Ornithinibacter sp.]|jgi:CheY-like chemotaxis protein|uniref:response regulator transcription factor n=1 Tax=Ornithinibacter sp. TaxID=2862748 RepID=UPI001B5B6F6F|nr:response regulator [Ornithinibacter sp.]MBP6524189.1 response regulator [Dermatophilaceae bacterium]MBU9945273.1 response regulator [Dermatophilaceae bacterium]HQW74522.1 response regulator [Ornithinibacter sp.]HQX87936.1 response regulator [Ornithinibacter sp.]HQZ10577.1 response regulator [Ornithinibacter sp.]